MDNYIPPTDLTFIFSPTFKIKDIKELDFTEKDIIFFPVRDMRDATVSALDHPSFTNNVATFVSDQMRIFHIFRSNILWNKFNIVRYENFDEKHLHVARNVAKILNIFIIDSELLNILNYINGTDILTQPYEKVLLKPNHGTDRAVGKYKTRLQADQITVINNIAKEYQIYFNYDDEYKLCVTENTIEYINMIDGCDGYYTYENMSQSDYEIKYPMRHIVAWVAFVIIICGVLIAAIIYIKSNYYNVILKNITEISRKNKEL